MSGDGSTRTSRRARVMKKYGDAPARQPPHSPGDLIALFLCLTGCRIMQLQCGNLPCCAAISFAVLENDFPALELTLLCCAGKPFPALELTLRCRKMISSTGVDFAVQENRFQRRS